MEGKKRSSNFTIEEKSFLFRLIANKYAGVLEDKKTDQASVQKRDHTWKIIEKDFNAESPSNNFREAEVLKKLYSNKKKEVRKKVAEEKKEVLLTGGGLPPKIFTKGDDQTDDVLLSIMNAKTVHGLNNPFDSDIVDFPVVQDVVDPDVEFTFETVEAETNNIGTIDASSTTIQNTELELSYTTLIPTGTDGSKGTKCAKNRPLSNRRRPTTMVKALTSSAVEQKYDILIDKRLVLVEKQTKFLEEEHFLIMKKRKLEIELLELEISQKKKQ